MQHHTAANRLEGASCRHSDKMESKVLMSLLLVSMAVKGMAMGYDCERDAPPNCVNNPRINVLKDSNDYRVTLCSDNQCIPENPNGMSNWIECQDVCDACRLLPGQNGKIMRPYIIYSAHPLKLQ